MSLYIDTTINKCSIYYAITKQGLPTVNALDLSIKCMKMDHLNEQTKVLRKKLRCSQEYLTREISVSLSTVQRWETKGSKPIRLARMQLDKLFRRINIEKEKQPSLL